MVNYTIDIHLLRLMHIKDDHLSSHLVNADCNMEIGVRILGAVQLIISLLLIPVFYLLSFRKIKYVPPIKSDLLKLSATQLAKKIRNKELTSQEVVEAYIARIREVNPLLNAVVEDRFEDARQDAINVDKLITSGQKDSKTLEEETPLLGVPVTVKESCCVKGMSYCVGSLPRMGVKAEQDGQAVSNIKKAGGIPLCVTNTPELCLCWESNNLVTGKTNNPYNIYRTSGGSSGGEGALLGAGASLVGIGSDIAGSIRIPAMFNGVYGHKPTPRMISLEGHYPISKDDKFSKFLVLGPLTRYVEDLTLMMKVMGGENAKMLHLDQEVNLGSINVFYQESAGFSLVNVGVQDEITTRMLEAAAYLKNNHGCTVRKGNFDLGDSVEMSGAVFLGLNDIPHLLDISKIKKRTEMSVYVEFFKSLLGLSEFSINGMLFMLLLEHRLMISESTYPYYNKLNEMLKQSFAESLKDNGVLLYPTFPVAALHHGEIFVKTAGVMYTIIFNSLELPSTHVPLGLDKNGLPIGIQVVAAPYQDRLCLAVAKALDEKYRGWIPPPSA
ncbi:fatty-acid amide hydrolase 2-A-like isoform X1 [Cimex lectularius]|uniref:Amidase domain-containing protein n=2 Tax=Cimex lectularius TaxID=79782 RepID=A0A8I6SSL0_CIMLE|nr:fatty-acid amide hydrolase 2-A-like isoform X1 [Cimex lectularius]